MNRAYSLINACETETWTLTAELQRIIHSLLGYSLDVSESDTTGNSRRKTKKGQEYLASDY